MAIDGVKIIDSDSGYDIYNCIIGFVKACISKWVRGVMEREELCEKFNTHICKIGLELADNVDITNEYHKC